MICRDEILTHYNMLEWDNRDYWSEPFNEPEEPKPDASSGFSTVDAQSEIETFQRGKRYPNEPIPHDFLNWNFEAIRKQLSEGRKCPNGQCTHKHLWSATQKVAYLREAVIQATITRTMAPPDDPFVGLCNLEIERLQPEAEREAWDRESLKRRLDGRKANRFPKSGGRPGYYTMEQWAELDFVRMKSELSVAQAVPEEADRPNQFTRKQAIYLLQELIPEFKTADNTRKAEFITKLTGYISTKNIADEFSNIRNFADTKLLDEWKERLKTSGRGRKKKNP